MILILGEIVFDLFPGHKKMGGAPFNFAFHLKKMGVPVRFVSRVGADALGREVLAFLEHHGFNTDDIQVDQAHPTGTVKVSMNRQREHEFTIEPCVAWDYLDFDDRLSSLLFQSPDLVYFGTLVQRTPHGQGFIGRIIEQITAQNQKLSRTKFFCDINLRSDFYSPKILEQSLNVSNILKINDEELVEIAAVLLKKNISPVTCISHKESMGQILAEIAAELMKIYVIDLLILTRGDQGSVWFLPEKQYSCKAFFLDKIADTVGAGDAYAAMAVFGWLKEFSIETTMALAGEFACRICGIQGALPGDETIYQEFINR